MVYYVKERLYNISKFCEYSDFDAGYGEADLFRE